MQAVLFATMIYRLRTSCLTLVFYNEFVIEGYRRQFGVGFQENQRTGSVVEDRFNPDAVCFYRNYFRHCFRICKSFQQFHGIGKIH